MRALHGAALALLLVSGGDGAGTGLAPSPPRPRTEAAPAQVPRVYLVTAGQGDQIWERFGHNFLAVEDPATGAMIAYNWGVFDFAAPDFLSRFLLGDTRYWMQGDPLEAVLAAYPRYNRTVTLQRLALTPVQADSLQRFLAWNAREENRYYRYDYFRDNCSTRLRDALDRALGGALRRATGRRLTNNTYRRESLRLTDEAPAAQLGIDVALGQPADAALSAWESMFVPMRVAEYVRDIQVPGPGGAMVPLVMEERVVYEAQRPAERTRAPSLIAELLAAGLALATVIALLVHRARRAGRKSIAANVIAAAWGGVAGTIGVVLVLAWAATQHVFWYRNENLFQLNPIALALVVLIPMALRNPRWWRAARTVAVAVAGLSILGAVLKFLPGMIQQNWEVVLFALPVNVAVAWAVGRVHTDRG